MFKIVHTLMYLIIYYSIQVLANLFFIMFYVLVSIGMKAKKKRKEIQTVIFWNKIIKLRDHLIKTTDLLKKSNNHYRICKKHNPKNQLSVCLNTSNGVLILKGFRLKLRKYLKIHSSHYN